MLAVRVELFSGAAVCFMFLRNELNELVLFSLFWPTLTKDDVLCVLWLRGIVASLSNFSEARRASHAFGLGGLLADMSLSSLKLDGRP